MAIFVMMTREQLGLEADADEMLRNTDVERDYPFTTENNLSRRGLIQVPLEAIAEWATAPTQSYCDELKFLISISALPQQVRGCMRLWSEGYSQCEIALMTRVSQQCVSKRLREGLRVCYDSSPVTFRRFSQHTIYRPPQKPNSTTKYSRCLRCGDKYSVGAGAGRYCSTECRQESIRRNRRSRGMY
ncbi:MAG: hypothetical protein ABJA67_10170 [Chthonomonadales bacterium]